jgi:metal-sulfur cluster biosynthetic enzyme
VDMTMTTPACPLHTLILNQAHAVLSDTFSQVKFIHVNLVWDPPWSPERMTPVARQMLGWTS